MGRRYPRLQARSDAAGLDPLTAIAGTDAAIETNRLHNNVRESEPVDGIERRARAMELLPNPAPEGTRPERRAPERSVGQTADNLWWA